MSTPTRMRFLGPLAAVLDMDQQQTGYVALPPGVQATAPGVLRTRVIHVVSKVGAQWKIVFTQNTALLPAP